MALSATNTIAQPARINGLSPMSARLVDTAYRLAGGTATQGASARDVARLQALAANTSISQTNARSGAANAAAANSLLAVAEEGLTRIGDLLTTQQSLAETAADATLSDSERGAVTAAFRAASDAIDQIVQSTRFNGRAVLDGSFGASSPLRVATDGEASVSIAAQDTATLYAGAVPDVSAAGAADAVAAAISANAAALASVSATRVGLADSQRRLEGQIGIRANTEETATQEALRAERIAQAITTVNADAARAVNAQAGLLANNVLQLLEPLPVQAAPSRPTDSDASANAPARDTASAPQAATGTRRAPPASAA